MRVFIKLRCTVTSIVGERIIVALVIMSETIPESDQDKVINILNSVKHRWKDIGAMLRIAPPELEAITHDYHNSSEQLFAMVRIWLTSDDNPTWPGIVEALRTPHVNERRLSEQVRERYCPDYIIPREPTDGLPNETEDPHHRCTRWGAAGLLAVISVCIGVAFGGITLIVVGIRGFTNDEDYTCSLGPKNVFNSLNLITGVVFLSGLVIIVLFIFYYFFKHIHLARKIIYGIIVGVIAGSIVLITADAIYSFYVASQLLPEVKTWEEDKSMCGSGVFRSSFAIILTYFLLISVGGISGAIAISIYILRVSRPCRHLFNFHDSGENPC